MKIENKKQQKSEIFEPSKNRRGQAALEFLMTYGWAFLVVLVMIGALAYFGVLNPSKVLPERCVITPGFDCQDFVITDLNGNKNITVVMVNQVGRAVTVQNFNLTTPTDMVLAGCNVNNLPSPYPNVGAGAQITMVCSLTGGQSPAPGDKMKIELDMWYLLSGTTFNRSSGVEVFSVVQ